MQFSPPVAMETIQNGRQTQIMTRFVPNLSNNHLFLLLKLIDKPITFILSRGIWVILFFLLILFNNIWKNIAYSGIILLYNYIIKNQKKNALS